MEWIKKREKLEEILSQLSEKAKEVFLNIEEKDWCPLWVFEEVFNAISKIFKEDINSLFNDFGRSLAKQTITDGYLKAFISFVSHEKLIKRIPMLWKRYSNESTMEIKEIGDKHVLINYYPPKKTPHPVHTPLISGFLREIFSNISQKNIEISEIKCALNGGERCEWRIVWD